VMSSVLLPHVYCFRRSGVSVLRELP
jgi:hypothetical protein